MQPIRKVPTDELKTGTVYRLRARRMNFGVWDGDRRTFIGLTYEFDTVTFFEEDLYELGGTAYAIEAIGVIDASIDRQITLGTCCSCCNRPTIYLPWTANEVGNGYPGRWVLLDADDNPVGGDAPHRITPVAVADTALFDALHRHDPLPLLR